MSSQSVVRACHLIFSDRVRIYVTLIFVCVLRAFLVGTLSSVNGPVAAELQAAGCGNGRPSKLIPVESPVDVLEALRAIFVTGAKASPPERVLSSASGASSSASAAHAPSSACSSTSETEMQSSSSVSSDSVPSDVAAAISHPAVSSSSSSSLFSAGVTECRVPVRRSRIVTVEDDMDFEEPTVPCPSALSLSSLGVSASAPSSSTSDSPSASSSSSSSSAPSSSAYTDQDDDFAAAIANLKRAFRNKKKKRIARLGVGAEEWELEANSSDDGSQWALDSFSEDEESTEEPESDEESDGEADDEREPLGTSVPSRTCCASVPPRGEHDVKSEEEESAFPVLSVERGRMRLRLAQSEWPLPEHRRSRSCPTFKSRRRPKAGRHNLVMRSSQLLDQLEDVLASEVWAELKLPGDDLKYGITCPTVVHGKTCGGTLRIDDAVLHKLRCVYDCSVCVSDTSRLCLSLRAFWFWCRVSC